VFDSYCRGHAQAGSLAPTNNAPSPPKLKHETLYTSGVFVIFRMSRPLF